MKIEHRIDQVINLSLPAIVNGEETFDSILAKYPHLADELRPRLEAALWLYQARQVVDPRPGFVSSSRKYLETQIESMQPHGFWRRLFKRYSPQRWVFNIVSPIIIFLLLALVINSAVLTARLSIPGDPLYSTKLVIEDIQLAFTFNLADKTDLSISFSRERAMEFVELLMEGEYEYLPTATRRMETEIIASLHALEALSSYNPDIEQPQISSFRDTLSNEITLLNVLIRTSPASALPGIELAIQVTQSGLMALR